MNKQNNLDVSYFKIPKKHRGLHKTLIWVSTDTRRD